MEMWFVSGSLVLPPAVHIAAPNSYKSFSGVWNLDNTLSPAHFSDILRVGGGYILEPFFYVELHYHKYWAVMILHTNCLYNSV